MLLVMLISLVLFVIIRPQTLALRVLSRVLLVPAIAGISMNLFDMQEEVKAELWI